MGLGIGQDKLEGNNKMKESIGFKSPGDNGEREREREIGFKTILRTGSFFAFGPLDAFFFPEWVSNPQA